MIESLQGLSGQSSRKISAAVGLSYRRLLRWQQRVRQSIAVIQPPGPKKAGPVPLGLITEMKALRHGHKRSHGAGALYGQYRDVVSRRGLARLIASERQRLKREGRALIKRVEWHQPNLAWATDATERGRDEGGRRLYIHAVRDLHSRYGFKALVAVESKGEPVAAHLAALFREHGAPLFLKRDNGSAFNNQEVDQVLADFAVIPLNSPARYPGYNGAIENGIGQLKAALAPQLPQASRWDPSALAPYILAVQTELNSRPRRVLRGHSACEAYYGQPRLRYSKRQRLSTFEWIQRHAMDRLSHLDKVDHRSALAAWRLAAETWLRCQGLITVSINKQVLPYFPRKYVHY